MTQTRIATVSRKLFGNLYISIDTRTGKKFLRGYWESLVKSVATIGDSSSAQTTDQTRKSRIAGRMPAPLLFDLISKTVVAHSVSVGMSNAFNRDGFIVTRPNKLDFTPPQRTCNALIPNFKYSFSLKC